jgi:hypothetical protein
VTDDLVRLTKPALALALIRSVCSRNVAIRPAMAGSTSSRVSAASKTGSLSSCRSRL